MSELRNLARRLGNQPLRVRALQAANLTLTATLGRSLELVHLVEYPKCGGSWIRNMMADSLELPHFLEDRLIMRRDVIQVHRLPKPWYRRVVVVTRDPRDMYVSTYYHETQYRNRERGLLIGRWFQHDPSRPRREDFANYLEAKLTHHTHPPFLLHEFVRSWKRRPDTTWTRYEDFLRDAEAELMRVTQELGMALDAEAIRKSVHANTFENATRRRGDARKAGETDSGAFERKGVAGDWKNHFNARSCALLEKREGESLRSLGYEVDAGWVGRFLAAD